MAKLGIIPKKFNKCDTPTCATCIYAKSTRKPCRGRSIKAPHKRLQVTHPGQIVSMEQQVSPTPGLGAHMNGILATKIYKYATVFVDHFSIYSYMHLHQTASSEDAFERKHSFEIMTASYGIIVKQYYADNGIFRENAWVLYCQERANTHLKTYSGVDTCHNNRLAERRTRYTQENSVAMMLHAQHKFPEAITTNLWPYALRHANNAYNATTLLSHHQGLSPLNLFTRTKV